MKKIIYYCDVCNSELKDNEEYILCITRRIGTRKGKQTGQIVCKKCFVRVEKTPS